MKSKVDSFDKYSIHFKKWLIRIEYTDFEKPIFLVWLTDTLDNEEDKILTNSKGQLIGSSKADSLINYILGTTHKLFDSRLTRTWQRKLKELNQNHLLHITLIKFSPPKR